MRSNTQCSERKLRRRAKGFSLIEVLFAIFLMAISVVIIAAAMPTANGSRARADLNNKATSMAQKMLESVRGLGYANCTAPMLFSVKLIDSTEEIDSKTYSFTNVDTTALDNPSKVLPSGEGRVKLEQADLDLRRVTVEVRYRYRGVLKSVRIGTLIANI